MHPVIALVLGAVGKTLLSLLTALLTEKFLKKAIIASLEKLVDKTQSDFDNRLLAAAKEAWEESPSVP